MVRFLKAFGSYIKLLGKILAFPQKPSIYYNQLRRELEVHGIASISLIIAISLFVGAALTIQSEYNIVFPGLPRYIIGLTVRDALLLEFSSTMVGLMIAGKSGSGIASEIGMMRVTEQIDALEVMGVNSASYLILPKLIALLVFLPILCIISIAFGLIGGYLVCLLGDVIPVADYIAGLKYLFYPHHVSYALIKSVFYGFIVGRVSGYFGFTVSGGAKQVGKASTMAVVTSSILILLINLVLTQIILH